MQEGNKELQAAVPVTQQQHHANQIKDSYHCTRQIIRHVENLWEEHKKKEKSQLLHLVNFQSVSNDTPHFSYLNFSRLNQNCVTLREQNGRL